jgi:hypothetical protein
VQTKIKETYKNANFIHCYTHQLNLIMEKSSITKSRSAYIIFSSLSGISSFFSRLRLQKNYTRFQYEMEF